jgi:predicted phage gp36 major capsid-like protein
VRRVKRVQEELEREEAEREREEAERDKRVAAIQKLLDEALAAHSLAHRLQDAMGRATTAERKLERQAELLRTAYERNWFHKLLNWGQH